MNTTAIVAGLGLALTLSGCISPENDRISVGKSLRFESLQAARPSEGGVVPNDLVAPSVVNIERDNWKRTEILVPVDGTAHKPIYARRVNITNKTRRQRDFYPTASSSLDMSGGSEGQQQREAVYNVGMGVLDVLFLIPRAIWRAPWRTDASPDDSYARYWHPGLAPGQRQPLPEDTDPFAEPSPRSVTP